MAINLNLPFNSANQVYEIDESWKHKKIINFSDLTTKNKSDSFPHASCILWVVENTQIVSDTSQSAQIISGLSKLQSCLDILK